MSADVGGIIAAAHAKKAGCPICELDSCRPVVTERVTRNGDHFERLICLMDNIPFRRVWIDGYPRRESALIDPKTKKPMHVTA
ncbi:MAG: hypothetical protein V7672_00780 [Brevundimonas sp.]|uniref:hypothetical protein n=1 Tax=Brevundimonas sp. TaxID=1871086 RepID=UPI0030014E1E